MELIRRVYGDHLRVPTTGVPTLSGLNFFAFRVAVRPESKVRDFEESSLFVLVAFRPDWEDADKSELGR